MPNFEAGVHISPKKVDDTFSSLIPNPPQSNQQETVQLEPNPSQSNQQEADPEEADPRKAEWIKRSAERPP